MYTIVNIRKLSAETIHCRGCEKDLVVNDYWNVDGECVCNDCISEEPYSDLVKCSAEGCNHYDMPKELDDGLCAECEELNSPMDPADMEGLEHNIRKMNEGD